MPPATLSRPKPAPSKGAKEESPSWTIVPVKRGMAIGWKLSPSDIGKLFNLSEDDYCDPDAVREAMYNIMFESGHDVPSFALEPTIRYLADDTYLIQVRTNTYLWPGYPLEQHVDTVRKMFHIDVGSEYDQYFDWHARSVPL
ncbi:hypothetical protein EXIGLDRAFT_833067 [Exidia glandulosa HHB12029]|uniref:Uncharacterized protein n=1 Tax=Exidia glandulosa HHB12029 TaxID=1314781 RepID=A0A165L1R7_EXIGL|nr:hypothetical protein EXIGLDRAFT_833067 [Exidia glandulosa HHB12029]